MSESHQPGKRLSGLPFVTADLVKRSDGIWRVIEVGDGQVSDRPASASPWIS
jgi:ATP-grasp domain, R2K clade family 3